MNLKSIFWTILSFASIPLGYAQQSLADSDGIYVRRMLSIPESMQSESFSDGSRSIEVVYEKLTDGSFLLIAAHQAERDLKKMEERCTYKGQYLDRNAEVIAGPDATPLIPCVSNPASIDAPRRSPFQKNGKLSPKRISCNASGDWLSINVMGPGVVRLGENGWYSINASFGMDSDNEDGFGSLRGKLALGGPGCYVYHWVSVPGSNIVTYDTTCNPLVAGQHSGYVVAELCGASTADYVYTTVLQ